jgi:hypothetical protein
MNVSITYISSHAYGISQTKEKEKCWGENFRKRKENNSILKMLLVFSEPHSSSNHASSTRIHHLSDFDFTVRAGSPFLVRHISRSGENNTRI